MTPASAGDIATTIAFARANDLPFAVRCGGHSYGGYSTSDGIVIDVSPMSSVRVTGAGLATVGAGARSIDVAAGLAPHGVMVPEGTCVTVGISGLTLGGGQGMTGRRFGLTCDSLRGATVVLADGSIARCDEEHEPELFWALRGAGGGNVGVVTSFTFETHALRTLSTFSISWGWDGAAVALATWQDWAPDAPDDLWSTCRARWIPGSGPQLSVTGAWTGDPDALAGALEPIATVPGAAVSTRTSSYLDTVQSYGGCGGRPLQDCRLAIRGGTLSRQAAIAKSDFFDRTIAPGGGEAVLSRVEDRGGDAVLAEHTGGVLFDAWGGRIRDVAADATAFPYRDARFLAQEFVTFDDTPSRSVERRERSWLNGLWRALRPAASGGAYVNYIDPELRGWEQAYYGANLPRLVEAKRTYDPDDVFRFAQSIPLSLD